MYDLAGAFQRHIHKDFLRGYLALVGVTMEEIKKWDLPVAAARWRE